MELTAAGFERRATAWLMEGLLFYLAPPDGQRLLKIVTESSEQGSVLALEHVNEVVLKAMHSVMTTLAARGAPWQSSVEDPELWLSEHGWNARVLHHEEAGAKYGRTLELPFPALPQVPKAYLIEARRR